MQTEYCTCRLMVWPLQEEKLGKQEITEINKDMTLGPMDSFKKKMGW